jgi:hypothetical protein
MFSSEYPIRSFVFLMCLVALSACSRSDFEVVDIGGWKIVSYKHHAEPAPFEPTQVSCTDMSSPELRDELEAVYNNPLGDIYWPSNEAIDIMKKVADRGKIEAIASYGNIWLDRIFIENHEYTDKHTGKTLTNKTYPDNTKPYIVEGLTYVYISSIPESPITIKILNVVKKIELNRYGMIIPQQWIDEAKANAGKWQAYCARH